MLLSGREAVKTFLNKYPAMKEAEERYPWFGPMLIVFANRLTEKITWRKELADWLSNFWMPWRAKDSKVSM